MDLNDFGTQCDAAARAAHHDNSYSGSGMYGSSEAPMLPIQWKLSTPGVFEAMQTRACTQWRGAHLVEGAGHWVQQEQPAAMSRLLIEFLRG